MIATLHYPPPRWNCSSLQDSMDSQVSLIKAHLGERMRPSAMLGGKVAAMPALSTSSLYPQVSATITTFTIIFIKKLISTTRPRCPECPKLA